MGFTEVSEFLEADGGVRIVERKEFDVQWSAVESIDVTDRLAVFNVTRKGLLFLPRWAFKDEEAFHCFVETAQKLWRAFARGEHVGVSAPPKLPADGLRLPS